MKLLMFLLFCYCLIAYVCGFKLFLEVLHDVKDSKSEFYVESRPVFLAGAVTVLIYILFPILWPIFGIMCLFDKDDYLRGKTNGN